ncbi:MAG: AraC family transcriptional regulator [Deltaproteobacteria bacterium]|nr:AraC family transcriptional regulator [Deltaproteobacteria bacterium]
MDSLSPVLRSIRLRSQIYFRKDFPSPWGFDMAANEVSQFHLVARGRCFFKVDGAEVIHQVNAGDAILLPHGQAHWLASEATAPRLPGTAAFSSGSVEDLPPGEDSTTLICGHFELDRGLDHPLIESLPQWILVPASERRQATWLETSTTLLIDEMGSGEPGSEALVNRLAEGLFILLLRAFILRNRGKEGYFAALADRRLSRALGAIHDSPGDSWSLPTLASLSGMSRSSFADRFSRLVGMPPMKYLGQWRLQRARELLRDTELPLSAIAGDVGFASEGAFGRAFKRHFRINPGALRRQGAMPHPETRATS